MRGRRGIIAAPLLHGGGQERDVRSGTLDVPAIAAFAVAVEVTVKEQAQRAESLAALRDDLIRRVLDVVPDAQLNGDPTSAPAHRLPGNAHFSFPGCEGDALLMLLDARGIREAIVVTDPYHLFRARQNFFAHGLDVVTVAARLEERNISRRDRVKWTAREVFALLKRPQLLFAKRPKITAR